MIARLIPFIAGAAIGAVTTYIYKDKKSRETLKKGMDTTSEKVSDGVDSIKSAFAKKEEKEPEEVEVVVEDKVEEKSSKKKKA